MGWHWPICSAPAKLGPEGAVSLHRKTAEPPMSQMGHSPRFYPATYVRFTLDSDQ
jgi:hypothetical protein